MIEVDPKSDFFVLFAMSFNSETCKLLSILLSDCCKLSVIFNEIDNVLQILIRIQLKSTKREIRLDCVENVFNYDFNFTFVFLEFCLLRLEINEKFQLF